MAGMATPSMDAQDYKWVIEYDRFLALFVVTGYVRIDGGWSRDGGACKYTSLSAALDFIQESEWTTSRTK